MSTQIENSEKATEAIVLAALKTTRSKFKSHWSEDDLDKLLQRISQIVSTVGGSLGIILSLYSLKNIVNPENKIMDLDQQWKKFENMLYTLLSNKDTYDLFNGAQSS